jgi:hypothetical protein
MIYIFFKYYVECISRNVHNRHHIWLRSCSALIRPHPTKKMKASSRVVISALLCLALLSTPGQATSTTNARKLLQTTTATTPTTGAPTNNDGTLPEPSEPVEARLALIGSVATAREQGQDWFREAVETVQSTILTWLRVRNYTLSHIRITHSNTGCLMICILNIPLK